MTRNLTVGSPAKLILMFTIPLLVGNLFQQFYNMADTFIVGRTLGVNALAAVGCTGSLMFLVVGFAMGLTSGMSIVTARRFGAEDYIGVKKSFAAGIVIALFVAVALTLVSVAFTRPLLRLMQTPPEILEDAYQYIVVIFVGIAASVAFNLFSNTMRAVGDSRSPLLFLVIACLLNIVLDYVLIRFAGMGVRGAAVATIVAQGVSAALCMLYIRRRLPVLRLSKRDFSMAPGDLKEQLRMGLPMGFQSSIIAIGAVAVQFVLNTLGAEAVAAYTAAQKIDTLCTLPLMSFGITMATYVAQNHGAGKTERIREGVVQCCVMSVSFAVCMGVVNVLAGDRFARFFLSGSPEVATMSHQYLTISGCCYFLLALLFIFRYSLQGLGQSVFPTVAGIVELVMRSFAAVVLAGWLGFTGACVASPLAWLGACIPLAVAFVRTLRRLQLQDARAAEDAADEEDSCAAHLAASRYH